MADAGGDGSAPGAPPGGPAAPGPAPAAPGVAPAGGASPPGRAAGPAGPGAAPRTAGPGGAAAHARWPARLHAVARRAPFAVSLAAAVLVLGTATTALWRPLAETPAAGWAYGLPALSGGRWWSPATGVLVVSSPGRYLPALLLVLALLVPAELLLGTRRTVAAFAVTSLAGVLGTAGMLLALRGQGWAWVDGLSADVDAGALTGALGALMVATGRMRAPWRARVRFFLVLYATVTVVYVGSLWDVEHAVGLLAALPLLVLLGPDAPPPRPRPPRPRTGRHEARVLVAGYALALVLTGAVTVVRPGAGPLAGPGLAPDEGNLLLSVVTFLLLLLMVEGLRRGRRVAWRWAVALTALPVAGLLLPPYDPRSLADLLLAGGLLVALVARRDAFAVRVPPAGRWRPVRILGATVAGLAVYTAAGFRLLRGFDPDPDARTAAAEFAARLGFGSTGELRATTRVSQLFLESLSVAWFVAVLAALAAVYVRGPLARSLADRRTAVALLERHGGDRLAWMTTWPDNAWWIDDDRDAYVAYRVRAGVALALGDPVCPQGQGWARYQRFAAFCAAAGWVPCAFAATADLAGPARAAGARRLQVAEEAVVDLVDLAFRGRVWQDVRTALNRAGKEGVAFRLARLAEEPWHVQAQVRAISEQWVADKGLPEMGFTLGGVEEAMDPAVRVGLAVDAAGRVHGVTSWMPVHAPGGAVVGWALDVMRRREDGFRTVMEFLIASAALAFRAEGAEVLSLSGAPLARRADLVPPDRAEAALLGLLDAAAEVMEPFYGFRSLQFFKSKFQPRYEPLYLVYPDEAALPRIALAVGRAYLPDLRARDLARLAAGPPEGPRRG